MNNKVPESGYPTYGYVIVDTSISSAVIAGSLSRDYIYEIKLLSDLVDTTGNKHLRIIPLMKEEYEFINEGLKNE